MSGYRESARARRLVMAVVAVAFMLAGPAVGSAAAAPEYVSPPYISGNERLGERLTCDSGTWKGAPKFEYEWVREGIGFEKAPTYTLSKADEHKEVWCVVTAYEIQGSEHIRSEAFAESTNSICLGGNCGVKEPPEEPINKKRPEVSPSGTVEVGKTLTCSQGEWSGRPPPTFTYKWLRDKAEAIKLATSNTYTVVSKDEGHALSCDVTAKNEVAEKTVESTNSVTVPGKKPENTKKPEVLGVPAVNETLTCYEGTWTGAPAPTFTFQWLRNGAEIPMATGPTYIVAPADEGQSLSCTVIAKNGLGKGEASSAVVVVSGKLKNTEPPVIEGTPKENETLKCSGATWNQEGLTLKYHWLRESEAIGESKEYKVASADRGHLLYCQVSAMNSKGEEVTATSQPVGVAKGPGVPKIEILPEVEGNPTLHSTLTCSPGKWTNSPTQYVFQWLRGKKAIANATASTHEVEEADEGHTLSCKVIAQNSEGPSEPAESPERYVSGEAPSVKTPPEVHSGSATPRVGESLICLRGEWKGKPLPTFTYEWLREGTAIPSATSAAYTIAIADGGHSLSCTVTATNDEAPGGVSASSNSLYIPGSPPEPPLEGPKISGEPIVGKTLTCSEGAWTGAPAPTFTFQWLLNGTDIPSATKPTFTVGSADRGFVLSCRVTGTSSEGKASALSKGVHVLGVRPEPVEPPFISGTAAIGQTLTCQRGVWNGKPPPSFTYRWFRDGTAIASATEAAYTVEPGDQSHLLSCNVTATNSEGSVEAESVNGVAIASRLPQTIVEPSVIGRPVQPVLPSAGVILASLNRQLSFGLAGAHLKSVLKAGGYAFSFIAPTGGTLEVLWYMVLKGAHGAKSKQLVVGQSNTPFAFTGSRKSTIKVRLTANGRKLLKHKKRVSLQAKAIFTIPHEMPVIWSETIVLSR